MRGCWFAPESESVSGHRFPYDVIYQRLGGDLLILALAHKKRAPMYWVDRI